MLQLEKRLHGLNHITEAIAKVLRKSAAAASSVSGGSSGGGATTSLDEGYLCRWLLRAGVVDELFGASMHLELVARADGILRFLAQRGALSTGHLEAMWSATLGKHEAVVRELYALIVALVPHLPPAPRLYLFGRIAALPFHEYDEETLNVSARLVVSCFTCMPLVVRCC